MAKVTTNKPQVVVTLELSVAEAQYVRAALFHVDPKHLDGDPVWDALHAALDEAGFELDPAAIG